MIAAEHVMQVSFGIQQLVSVRLRDMLPGARSGSSRPRCQVNAGMTRSIGI